MEFFLAMEAQYGISIGGQRSVDHDRSGFCTYRNFNRWLEKVGLEREEHNPTVSLRFSITKCVRGSYLQPRIYGISWGSCISLRP